MNKNPSSENRPWPSTQKMLLDHLRRIVEGVFCIDEGSGNEQWWFGFEDCVISWSGDGDDPQVNERSARVAQITMFLSCLAVEARDRPSGPGGEFIEESAKSISSTTGSQDVLQTLAKHFSNAPLARQSLSTVLPEKADTEALQQAYAFEMLNKLDRVVDRSKTEAVRETLNLATVPEGVDDFLSEAAACFRYGFDKACLAMCRTTLEESLKKRIAHDHGRQHIQIYDPSAKRFVDKGLRTLIDDAHKTYGPVAGPLRHQRGPKYLSDQLNGAADRIRRWGNEAVHGKSDIPRGVVASRAQKALLHSKQLLRHLWASA